ncbi:MAG: hypothetical protein J6I84_03905 [Bacilli bacterium]|nr:hypothetical protein [Bacilli bacterium]
MTKDEILEHPWENGQKVWVVECDVYRPKNPFYIHQDGRSSIEFYFPTGQIKEYTVKWLEYSKGKYFRCSFEEIDTNNEDYRCRNHSFQVRHDSSDTLNLYNYHFNKFLTEEDAKKALPRIKKQLEIINLDKYEDYLNRSEHKVMSNIEDNLRCLEDTNNLVNKLEEWIR